MEPDVGFEPTTYRLQGGCSTVELIWHKGRRASKYYLATKAIFTSFVSLDFFLAALFL